MYNCGNSECMDYQSMLETCYNSEVKRNKKLLKKLKKAIDWIEAEPISREEAKELLEEIRIKRGE